MLLKSQGTLVPYVSSVISLSEVVSSFKYWHVLDQKIMLIELLAVLAIYDNLVSYIKEITLTTNKITVSITV